MAITPTFDLRQLLPPFHEHTLPSNSYFEGAPSIVSIRGLTVKELKHLTASGRLDKKALDQCISACIKESVDLSKLLLQDYNYITYLVRLYTSGNKASGAKRCASCGEQFTFDYDVTECAEIKTLEEVLPQTKTVILPRFKEQFGLSISLEVRPLTRADFVRIDNAIRQANTMAAKLNQPVSLYPFTELLKAHIVQISGFPDPVPKDQLVDYLSADEANLITSAFKDDEFGLSGKTEIKCPVCHTDQEYVIPFTDLFFQ